MNAITPVIFYSEPDAVAMSFNTFNQLIDTVHLLKSPANSTHLARSVEQFRLSQLVSQDLVDAD
jgi:antitoxin YefM